MRKDWIDVTAQVREQIILQNARRRREQARNIARMSVSNQSREPIYPEIKREVIPNSNKITELSEISKLQQELNTTKNELKNAKEQINKLQSQFNERIVNDEVKDKNFQTLQKQMQNQQQIIYELYVSHYSSLQQIFNIINQSKEAIKNNDVTFEPSNETTDLILMIIEEMQKSYTKWEPFFEDVRHLHKTNLENSKTSHD